MKITIFRSFTETDTPYYTTVEKSIDRIRTGASADKIAEIRSEPDKDTATKLKKKLPCVLYSGKFFKRNDQSQTEHSGVIILDFDHTENPAELRDSLKEYAYIIAAWISPSGNGVKALARIPATISQHRGHYAAILKVFPELDSTSCNESRICYESHDPDVWFESERDTVFEDYVVPEEPKYIPIPTGRAQTDYSKINVCVGMLRKAQPGSRNITVLKASKLAGGYIASGYIPESVAYQALEDEVRLMFDASEVQEELHTVRNGIEYGKLEPLYEQIPEEKPAEKTEAGTGIKYLSHCLEKMKHQFVHGKLRGDTTHFSSIDPHYTWKKGDLTLYSGQPGAGKSEICMQMMLVKSVYSGWKWAVFSPEAYPEEEFYDGLIHSLVGMSTDPHWDNQMSMIQYEEAAKFINAHFFYIYPDTRHTIDEIESYFIYLIKEEKIDGVAIDPNNQISRAFGPRDDQWLEEYLTSRKRFAIDYNICYCLVAHPKVMRPNSQGEFDAVDFYDLAGGAMWSNKIDNFLSIRRPNRVKDPADTLVELHVKKIKKQRLVGIPGMIPLDFRRRTNRYYEANGNTPLSIINSKAEAKREVLTVQSEIPTPTQAELITAWGAPAARDFTEPQTSDSFPF